MFKGCLSSKEESSTALMTLCPVGTGPLAVWTCTLFTPALKRTGVFIYLSLSITCLRDEGYACMQHFHLFPLTLIERPYREDLWCDFDIRSGSHLNVVSLPSHSCEVFLCKIYHKQRVMRFWNVHCVFGFMLDRAPLGGGLDIGRTWNIIHVMTCRIACSFFIHPNILIM